mmetsp:Transcript_6079/g.23023  ORF Transcript_6079/g.23023 Transcript_6079/m.23023 type:complete len:230 (-) Transcript_6079:44-733(-)
MVESRIEATPTFVFRGPSASPTNTKGITLFVSPIKHRWKMVEMLERYGRTSLRSFLLVMRRKMSKRSIPQPPTVRRSITIAIGGNAVFSSSTASLINKKALPHTAPNKIKAAKDKMVHRSECFCCSSVSSASAETSAGWCSVFWMDELAGCRDNSSIRKCIERWFLRRTNGTIDFQVTLLESKKKYTRCKYVMEACKNVVGNFRAFSEKWCAPNRFRIEMMRLDSETNN